MKKYWIILILVIIAGICIPVVIVYYDVPHAPKPILVYLNTDSMKEAHVTDSSSEPNIIKVYLCGHKNTAKDTIPWADAYLCRASDKADSLAGDSLIVYLDTQMQENLKDTVGIDQFEAGIKVSKKFKKCKVMLPPKLIDSIKKYKYKYGMVYLKGFLD